MKKLLLLTVMLTAFVFTFSNAQTTTGFKAGLSIADVNGLEFTTDLSGTAEGLSNSIEGGRTGYFVGFLVDIPLSNKLSFVPEFIYSQQGKDLEEFRLDYLNIPLHLKLALNDFYVGIGPQVGVKVWTPDQSNVFSNFEASAFGNIGYIHNSGFFLELRYSFGLTDIFQDGESFEFNQGSNPIFRNLEGSNAVIQLGLGFRLF